MIIWNEEEEKNFQPHWATDSEYVKILNSSEGKDGFKKYWRKLFLKFGWWRRYYGFGVKSITIFLDELEGWKL